MHFNIVLALLATSASAGLVQRLSPTSASKSDPRPSLTSTTSGGPLSEYTSPPIIDPEDLPRRPSSTKSSGSGGNPTSTRSREGPLATGSFNIRIKGSSQYKGMFLTPTNQNTTGRHTFTLTNSTRPAVFKYSGGGLAPASAKGNQTYLVNSMPRSKMSPIFWPGTRSRNFGAKKVEVELDGSNTLTLSSGKNSAVGACSKNMIVLYNPDKTDIASLCGRGRRGAELKLEAVPAVEKPISTPPFPTTSRGSILPVPTSSKVPIPSSSKVSILPISSTTSGPIVSILPVPGTIEEVEETEKDEEN